MTNTHAQILLFSVSICKHTIHTDILLRLRKNRNLEQREQFTIGYVRTFFILLFLFLVSEKQQLDKMEINDRKAPSPAVQEQATFVYAYEYKELVEINNPVHLPYQRKIKPVLEKFVSFGH